MNWPPNITGYSWGSDGSLTVNWEVDTFFPDATNPDDVSVELSNGVSKQNLGASARTINIPSAELKGLSSLTVTVVFEWTGGDKQQSYVDVFLADGRPVSVSGLAAPTLKVQKIQPKTVQNQNQITISWVGFSYTQGTVTWGPAVGPNFPPSGFKPGSSHGQPVYSGTFATNRPLQPGALYKFVVEIKNDLKAQVASSTVTVRAAPNYHSPRGFLAASGVSLPASFRGAVGHGGSLRAELGI